MKTILLAVLVALSSATTLDACPHCNIHNYLALSVESSTDIYIGEVTAVADREADVRVIEVIRGKRKPGEQTKVEFFGGADQIGTKHLFSNPTSWPPNFPHLPPSLKQEVSFLAGKDRSISGADDAVAKTRGVSRVTTDAALKYIKTHYPECRDSLLAAYRRLYDRKQEHESEFALYHQFENLVGAIMSVDDARSLEFLKSCIDGMAGEPGGDISWDDRPYRGELQGTILKTMLTSSDGSEETRRQLRAHLERRARETKGSGIRWFTYALGSVDLAACETLAGTFDAETRVAAAAGVYDLSSYYASAWSIENCDAARAVALQLHDGPKLRRLADRQNEHLKFHRPKKQP